MAALAQENIWFNKAQCEDAERMHYEKLSGAKVGGLAQQVGGEDMALASKLSALELENRQLKKLTDDLKKMVTGLEGRVASLEGGKKAAPAAAKEEDDDDVDLFGSEDEEEDEEKARITAERLKAYAEKKSKKPALIAKTSVLFDVKPWDDETDMNEMLKAVKTIEKDGLTWGANKLVPVGYGINKLQIMCVVEDEKVSLEELSEQIEAFEDYVQSVDIAAMNKI
uniref:Elongation factor 1-delta n=1 Tax=Pseudodiaptomus poplesia TaxID=213370 RepID=A0A0U2V272_9MAXI|nr:elongation factor 1-delta [Pseudodiaptomus poplesia]